jgi:hypothetical protein
VPGKVVHPVGIVGTFGEPVVPFVRPFLVTITIARSPGCQPTGRASEAPAWIPTVLPTNSTCFGGTYGLMVKFQDDVAPAAMAYPPRQATQCTV